MLAAEDEQNVYTLYRKSSCYLTAGLSLYKKLELIYIDV